MNPYETDKLLREYLLFHYGSAEEVMPWPDGPRAALEYPQRCVRECVNHGALPESARALDIGCAVGGSAFELARRCEEVIGIDYSLRFIEAAQQLAATGSLAYSHPEEGLIESQACAPSNPEGVARMAWLTPIESTTFNLCPRRSSSSRVASGTDLSIRKASGFHW